MLRSVLEERSRRFKLSLRAGIPIITLILLLFYATFEKEELGAVAFYNVFLLGAMVFVSIYFIFFLLEVDINETLLDHNTDTYNYEAFLKQLNKRHPKSVAIVRINNLSSINNNYGLDATNQLLRTLAGRIHITFRARKIKDIWIGRKIGAGYLVAANLNTKEMEEILEQFVRNNQSIDAIEIDYLFAVINLGETDPDRTIALLADTLNAQSEKTDKRFKKIKDKKALSELEDETIAALRSEAINLYFRPLYNIKRQKVDSYELVVKLRAATGKEILPRDFLPIINRLGLGKTYDLAIFKHIVDTALLVNEQVSFSFNLSPFSLRDSDFLKKIFAISEAKKIDTSRLLIELYERKTHHNLGKYLETLTKIRSKGFQICIDNFGSSNASLEYLKHFKFDRVQFDRDFVTKLENPNSLSIFKSLIDMSKGSKITTVAKWVDNETQKERLTALGVDYLQGFGIGRQLTEQQLIEHYN